MDGKALPREHQLLGVYVMKAVNRISSARLVYLDGSASSGNFPLSCQDSFLPGKNVEILAGAGRDCATLFQGIVVRQSLKIRESSASQLVIECRHQAVKLTVGRKSAYFFDQKDSDIIEGILGEASLDGKVEGSKVTYKQQVQYQSTDWDFLLLRAEANGKIVLTNDAGVSVKAPSFDGKPVCTLQFGATIIEMDAEMDARLQYPAVKSYSWDPAQQEVVCKEATDPAPTVPGNLSAAELSGISGLTEYRLQNGALPEEEAQAWADAQWLKSQLGKISGRIKCEGIAAVNPADLVVIGGVGERFSGEAFVTGVRQDFDTVQGWKTHIQFGNTDRWGGEEPGVSAPVAGALLPGVSGLQLGVVVSNEDPDGEDRIRVRMPLVDPKAGTWARVAAPDAGKERGFFFRPEIGDEVVLGFVNEDPRQAVVLGMLHSSAHPAPLPGSDDNHEKICQSRSKMKIYLNDEQKVMQFETPAGNRITLSEQEKGISVVDQNGNRIEMTGDGIVIESGKAITLKAGTEVKLESGSSFGIKGGSELKMEGAAGAELSSSAVVKVKGSMLQLN